MPKFRKKPVIIEAEQWFPGKHIEGTTATYDPSMPWDMWEMVRDGLHGKEFRAIKTLEGWHLVTEGDWVITGVAGEKYPCKPEIFAATYEPASEGEAV